MSPPSWVLHAWNDLATQAPGQTVVYEGLTRRQRGALIRRQYGHADPSSPQRGTGDARVAALLHKLVAPRGALASWRGHDEVGWRVLHSVPIGNGRVSIEHILIGPPGLVTITTKNLDRFEIVANEVHIGGEWTNYASNAWIEAQCVCRLFNTAATAHFEHLNAGTSPAHAIGIGGPVPVAPRRLTTWANGTGLFPEPLVTAVLAVVGEALTRDERLTVHGVDIVRADDLPHYLRSLPTLVRTTAAADAAYTLARRSSTWTRDPH